MRFFEDWNKQYSSLGAIQKDLNINYTFKEPGLYYDKQDTLLIIKEPENSKCNYTVYVWNNTNPYTILLESLKILSEQKVFRIED